MPKQSRGFFACDYCGLQHDTIEEALEHEQTQCPAVPAGRRPMGYLHPQQQQGLPQQYSGYYLQHQQQQTHHHGFTTGSRPLAATTTQGAEAYAYNRTGTYASYNRGISPALGVAGMEATYPQRSVAVGGLSSSPQTTARTLGFLLLDLIDDPSAERLTDADKIFCRYVEIFEATPGVIAEYERMSGDINRIEPKQVGIRCKNCGSGSNNHSGNPNSAVAEAIIFPPDIESVGDCVRKLSDRHLMSCKHGPGMMMTVPERKEGGADQALVDYCYRVCQEREIANKGNNRLGIEFTGSSTGEIAESFAPPSLDEHHQQYIATMPNRQLGVGGGAHGIQQQSYSDGFLTTSFPFYQIGDGTWHCKYCSYLPYDLRDPKSIWSSPQGIPPPNTFVDQHLSSCRSYQHQSLSSMPPGRGIIPPEQSSFGFARSYANPSHVQHGMPGQLPYPPGSHTTALGGMGSHIPFSQAGLLPPYQDHNYRYGQHPPPLAGGIVHPNSMDTSAGGRSGGRFHPPLGQGDSRGGYLERGGALRPSMQQADARGPSYALGSGDTSNSMEDAMAFLENFDETYYSRDPEAAAIPKLVLDEDHLLLTDHFFWLMKQLRLVRFTESDRKTRGGKREKIKVGYGGLQCIHCANLPMSRKFFWSNVDRLANSFAEIPGHVLKCRRCPQANKDALMRLKKGHPDQMSKLPRGSQKIFFRRMWNRLHQGDPQDDDVAGESPAQAPDASEGCRPPILSIKTSPEKSIEELSQSGTTTSDETVLVMDRSAKEAAKALQQFALSSSGPTSPSTRILLAIPEDKEWLSDIDSYIRKQLEVFCATEADVAAAQADRKYPISVGQVGIRCIHCAIVERDNAIGHAIAYPYSISGIYASVKEFHRLHLDSCPNIPSTTKAKLKNIKGAASLSSVLRNYYTLASKSLGLIDTKHGIRTGGEATPIHATAAFPFFDKEEAATPTKNKEGSEKERDSELPGTKAISSRTKQNEISTEEGFEEAAASTIRGTKRSGSLSASPETESNPKIAKIDKATIEV